MKGIDTNNITREELERLCALYFDGVLSRKEEQMLTRLLSTTDCRSELIDETIFVMGIQRASTPRSSALYADDHNPLKSLLSQPSLKKSIWRVVMSSAAAAVLILGLSALWHISFTSGTEDRNTEYLVYINGEKVENPDEAKKIALKNYEERMELLARLEQQQRTTIQKVENATKAYEEQINKAKEYTNKI